MIALWGIAVRLLLLPLIVAGLVVIGLGALLLTLGVQGVRFLTGDRC